ncbi:MAG: ArsR/SmtB family transcription factor [Promethearchaeota archaeon]
MNELKQLLIDFLKVLSDPTRLEILYYLKMGKRNSTEIQQHLNKSQSTISQHLKTLINSDLITFEKNGNLNYYYIKYEKIFTILSAISSFVIEINREKFKGIRDLDRYDVLL